MYFDALRVRFVDERLQWIEREGRETGLIRARDRRAIAEAITPPHGLHDDRVESRGLRARDDGIDAWRIEQIVAERVDPVRAELAPGGCRGIEVRGIHRLRKPGKREHEGEPQTDLPHYSSNDEATVVVAVGPFSFFSHLTASDQALERT